MGDVGEDDRGVHADLVELTTRAAIDFLSSVSLSWSTAWSPQRLVKNGINRDRIERTRMTWCSMRRIDCTGPINEKRGG
jgi:hypothetical protein